MYKFITFEGIDGVGKTTIGKMIAGVIRANFISTPYFRTHAPKDCDDKFSYYLKDIIDLQGFIRDELKSNYIVCDRYIHSTVAYHREELVGEVDVLYNKYNLIKPDLVILLTADFEERLLRIKNREMITGVINEMDHQSDFLRAVDLRFKQMSDIVIFDTKNKSISTICQQIREIIYEI
jgi:dTMP kinase